MSRSPIEAPEAFLLLNFTSDQIGFLRSRFLEIMFGIFRNEGDQVLNDLEAAFFQEYPHMRPITCQRTVAVLAFELFKSRYPAIAARHLRCEQRQRDSQNDATASPSIDTTSSDDSSYRESSTDSASSSDASSSDAHRGTSPLVFHSGEGSKDLPWNACSPSDQGSASKAGPSRRPAQSPPSPLAEKSTGRRGTNRLTRRRGRRGNPYPSPGSSRGPARMMQDVPSSPTYSEVQERKTLVKRMKKVKRITPSTKAKLLTPDVRYHTKVSTDSKASVIAEVVAPSAAANSEASVIAEAVGATVDAERSSTPEASMIAEAVGAAVDVERSPTPEASIVAGAVGASAYEESSAIPETSHGSTHSTPVAPTSSLPSLGEEWTRLSADQLREIEEAALEEDAPEVLAAMEDIAHQEAETLERIEEFENSEDGRRELSSLSSDDMEEMNDIHVD